MNVIEVANVSMRFNLATEKTESLKEYFVKLVTGKLMFDEFYALKNVSFSVKKGESVGILGANGSGKSTLLKVISGIYPPTEGHVSVHGSLAPLIELGAGFDPDLTAKENVFLNGAVMGFAKDFICEKYDEIVEFSELKNFMDVPIKNFSSGMSARLGFSIATLVHPDILIVDEVLGVGDAAFQKKCEQKMQEVACKRNNYALCFPLGRAGGRSLQSCNLAEKRGACAWKERAKKCARPILSGGRHTVHLNNELVSIIVLSYGPGKYYQRTLLSVLAQTYPAIDLIVSDDGSSTFQVEETESFIRQNMRGNVKRLLVRKNKHNLGISKHDNLAASLAKGKYIKFIADGDMFCTEHSLCELYEFACNHQEWIITSPCIICNENMTVDYYQHPSAGRIKRLNQQPLASLYETLVINNFISAVGVHIPKRVF